MTAPLHETHAGGSGRRLPDNQQGMRRRNLSRVMHTVNAEGPLSRAGVASHIGLTRAAVSTLVDELIRSGLLEELGPERPGRVGRPGSALALSGRGPAGIGAEIGVDHLAVCAVDLRGEVRARAERHGTNRGRAPEPVIEELTQLVRQVVAEAEGEGLWPAGLAVAVPGLVASDTRTVVRAPNLDWHDTDVGALLPDDLPVTVDNEANFGGLAELWLGDGTPSDFLHVSAEIGIGGAVVVDGRLLRGTRGFAGELGHVPVRPEGPDCACGGRGCLEQYAGEEAVLRAAGLEPGEHQVEFLAERAAAGDKHVHRALRGAGTALGVALTGAVNLLDPRTVVLGGALAALAPWLLPSLERELARRTAGPACSVTVSRLGSDGPLLGAAHSVVRGVLDDPATVGVRP
ncbi:ROK family transcriptional regulator [Streptomyces caniscabiei]|uniref:ROK family transcriptional regulator n=1 Tax=Streptomyces caniscabiei TaxID=2746961 RepID=A0ABU4MZZ3_9ACTN|nr:ROK family transcriptional regulator [Streptomyces caniscabiei]MBE4741240.1 ROK family transcriptional regulator [Streptomyces caniscabiei]MBE4760891.1 ROK family transcriptional regulator [Streptomyces caniscabiei]MBE4774952.1 ROK family transcriptional regulator [Streptomyces caniscabiei]MBE4789710.1 ROK family transcriptional regulator [Streptomyces caniscabiei]MBE4798893.1 ROK family transcriptional regulator [Streptomyces caniscabiei]